METVQQKKSFRKEIRQQTTAYLTAAFGLVAGLAWNEAIKGVIEAFFPLGTGGLLAKFIYAIGITIIVVLVTYFLVKKTEEEK